MEQTNYARILAEQIHSVIVATTDAHQHPVTRCIDIMLYDDQGIYFLTARGKEFYDQLMSQKYISLSGLKDKVCISLAGEVENIGKEKLDDIFIQNPYMAEIYPAGKRQPLEVFRIYKARGNYFDLTDPAHIVRGTFIIGDEPEKPSGYFIDKTCIVCRLCQQVCPQNCIDFSQQPARIDPSRCLHCGQCAKVCPVHAAHRYE